MDKITQAHLKELLYYEPETGDFIRLIRRGAAIAGDVAGKAHYSGYWYIRISKKHYAAHRLAWFYTHGFWPKEDIDHINNDRSDNRIVNLRECTRSQNIQNSKLYKKSSSGFKGVSKSKRNKKPWFSQIQVEGKLKYLGSYISPDLAHKAYCDAADKYFGEFANYG